MYRPTSPGISGSLGWKNAFPHGVGEFQIQTPPKISCIFSTGEVCAKLIVANESSIHCERSESSAAISAEAISGWSSYWFIVSSGSSSRLYN